MKIVESDLLSLGFKRKQKNKQKFIVHTGYDITLSKIDFGYIDINTNKKYSDYTDICSYVNFKELQDKAIQFKNGLSVKNLEQGNFKNVYKDTETKGGYFVDHKICKKLLEAKFNELITSSLMLSNGEPTYEYSITEAKYYFLNRSQLTLAYYYESKSGNHQFYRTFDIYDFEYKVDKFCIGRRQDISVPISFLLNNFITL